MENLLYNRINVCLAKADSYDSPELYQKVASLLDLARFNLPKNSQILVKPNLLMDKSLACANPNIVSCICKWLVDNGHKVFVADSPGFGRFEYVAGKIGLLSQLKKLNIPNGSFSKFRKVKLDLKDSSSKNLYVKIAEKALESDFIFSVCKVKAHRQMRVTLSVKNCFGVVPGLHKALIHARYGATHEFFSDYLTSIYKALPPVLAFADGITAMHVSGPGNGIPYNLSLLGASNNPPALDSVIMEILNISSKEQLEKIPLQKALAKQNLTHPTDIIDFPLLKPQNFNVQGFVLPKTLDTASFNPVRLCKSLIKRIVKASRLKPEIFFTRFRKK